MLTNCWGMPRYLAFGHLQPGDVVNGKCRQEREYGLGSMPSLVPAVHINHFRLLVEYRAGASIETSPTEAPSAYLTYATRNVYNIKASRQYKSDAPTRCGR